jgi:hypothetical protein
MIMQKSASNAYKTHIYLYRGNPRSRWFSNEPGALAGFCMRDRGFSHGGNSMFNKIKAHARERRLKAKRPTTNLMEVLNFLDHANKTEVRAITNSINDMPSSMRGKELSHGC